MQGKIRIIVVLAGVESCFLKSQPVKKRDLLSYNYAYRLLQEAGLSKDEAYFLVDSLKQDIKKQILSTWRIYPDKKTLYIFLNFTFVLTQAILRKFANKVAEVSPFELEEKA